MCCVVSVAVLNERVSAALLATPIGGIPDRTQWATFSPPSRFARASQARRRARTGAGPCVKRPRWSGSAVQFRQRVASGQAASSRHALVLQGNHRPKEGLWCVHAASSSHTSQGIARQQHDCRPSHRLRMPEIPTPLAAGSYRPHRLELESWQCLSHLRRRTGPPFRALPRSLPNACCLPSRICIGHRSRTPTAPRCRDRPVRLPSGQHPCIRRPRSCRR